MPPARIMIVEDEQITAADLEACLKELNYAVPAIVSSGAEAILKAKTTQPDLVLMDIRIKGDMDGIEAASTIRKTLDIPVIYLTAHADEETLERAKQAEPLGYIVKPFQESELRAAIQMALHKHKADKEARQREGQLSATLDALGEGIIGIDRMARVTYMNPAAQEWTGWQQKDAAGNPIDEVFKVIDRGTRKKANQFILDAMREGSLREIPGSDNRPESLDSCVVIGKDGSERPVGGSAAPIRDHLDHVSGGVVAFGIQRFQDTEKKSAPKRGPAPHSPEVVAESAAMQELLKFTERIAVSGVSSILLQGESGTGKDVIAKFLHKHSPRHDRPFVAINCAAIPETLLESELFGYEKGAFTDARAQKKGVLDLADGGTVFLDEIGELPLPLQAKLLRVLEDQSFRRLGGIKDVQVDVRIITATNRNLGEAVRDRQFREDLFYRVNVIQIYIAPLREHRDDIIPLTEHFIKQYNAKFDREIEGISAEAREQLLAHDWPGNVRELRNAVERTMVLEESSVLQASNLDLGLEGHLSLPTRHQSASGLQVSNMPLEEVEKTMLRRALEETGGNQTQAARKLGITRDTLRYRMKKFRISEHAE